MKRAHLFSLTLAALLSLTACGKSAQPIAEAAPKTRTLLNTVDTVTRDGDLTDIREYTYNPDGTIAKAVFTTLGENGYTASNTYEYDEEGRQTAVLQESNGYTARTETEYDESGRALRTVSINADGQVTSYSEFTYAEDGTVTQAAYSADGTPMGCTLTTQDAQGNPLTVETYTGDTLMMRMTYTYITVPAFR